MPAALFIIDPEMERIAVREANRLGIPVVAIVDTNCDPDEVDFPIPGNDDAARAIQLYCNLIADSVLDGMSESSMAAGQDLGASETVNEPALAATAAADAAAREARTRLPRRRQVSSGATSPPGTAIANGISGSGVKLRATFASRSAGGGNRIGDVPASCGMGANGCWSASAGATRVPAPTSDSR